jgi:ABC-type nitrate/sulfonate/bicarbonate transport system substrate-binding protein
LTVLAALALVLAACGDDDDSGGTTAEGALSEAGLPAPEKTTLEFGISALTYHSFPLHYASSTGILEKYGITELNETYTEGVATAISALQGGQLDVQAGTGSSVLSSLATDTPFLTVASTLAVMTDGLFSSADIGSMQDLQGQKIAISTFGGESHAAVVLALRAAGMTQEDVEITQIGGQGDRIAALIAGSVSAAPIDVARQAEMEAEGLVLLVNLAEERLELPRGGINVTRQFADENPNTILALVAATIEAIQLMRADPAAAAAEYADWAEVDLEEATDELELYLEFAQDDLRINPDAWDAMQDVLSVTNPAVLDVTVSDAYTTRFVDQLEEMGYFEQMGWDF